MALHNLQFCPKCGTRLTGNEHFCHSCGFDLLSMSQVLNMKADHQQPAAKNIPFEQNNTAASHQDATLTNNNSNKPKKKHKILKIVGIIIGVFILFDILLFMIGSSSKKDNGSASSTKVNTETKKTAETNKASQTTAPTTQDSTTVAVTLSAEEQDKAINSLLHNYDSEHEAETAQELAKYQESTVYIDICKQLADSYGSNKSFSSSIGTDISKFQQLYKKAFPNSSRSDKFSDFLKESEAIASIQKNMDSINSKYPGGIDKIQNSATNIKLYVSSIIKNETDTLAGKIQSGIDSISGDKTYLWSAHNVDYVGDTALPGDQFYALRTTESLPKSGVYDLLVYQTGETVHLTNENGFEHDEKVYQSLGNAEQVNTDLSKYQSLSNEKDSKWAGLLNMISAGAGKNNSNSAASPAKNTNDSQAVSSNTQAQSDTGNKNDYILPESNSKYYSASEILKLDKNKYRLARNEIFARRGRKFQTDDLNKYFSSKSWYHGTLDEEHFSQSIFNGYELSNIYMLVRAERGDLADGSIYPAADINTQWMSSDKQYIITLLPSQDGKIEIGFLYNGGNHGFCSALISDIKSPSNGEMLEEFSDESNESNKITIDIVEGNDSISVTGTSSNGEVLSGTYYYYGQYTSN